MSFQNRVIEAPQAQTDEPVHVCLEVNDSGKKNSVIIIKFMNIFLL